MTKLTVALVVLLAASAFALRASAGQMPQLSAAEKADGFKLMFDGKSLAGWRGYKTETPSQRWHVENGVLSLEGGGEGSDLMTVEQYGDFEMRFEWKISEKGNSGVIYHIATTE